MEVITILRQLRKGSDSIFHVSIEPLARRNDTKTTKPNLPAL